MRKDLPPEPSDGVCPANTWPSPSWLQNWERIHFCCFQSPVQGNFCNSQRKLTQKRWLEHCCSCEEAEVTQPEQGDVWALVWLRQVHGLVCDLVHYGHRLALSDGDVLWPWPPRPAVSARPAPRDTRSCWASGAGCFSHSHGWSWVFSIDFHQNNLAQSVM